MGIIKKIITAVCFFSLASCGGQNDTENGLGGSPEESPLGEQSKVIELTLRGMEPMVNQHYEGWVVGSGGVFTTGRFNLNGDGEVVAVDAAGEVIEVLSKTLTAKFNYQSAVGTVNLFVLTIELNGDTDPGASSVHYVGGAFVQGVAEATVDHGSAMGTSFLSSLGGYILATPTNGPTTHNQGIWFLDPDQEVPSLTLPNLATGWAYEGWVVDTQSGQVLSTGYFQNAQGNDHDGAGPAAGSGGFPPFPGQDFIDPAKILNDGNHKVVISVEPFPDFDPAPFTLKILAMDIGLNAPVTSLLTMDNVSNEDDIGVRARLK